MRLFTFVGWRRLVLLVIVAFTVLFGPRAAGAAGPWTAQIVDAETGQPLEGVVVLMYWIKYTGSFGGWAGGEFYDAEEVVTGQDGRFVVPSRSVFTLHPFKKVFREMVIFKPGYGQWEFRDAKEWEKRPDWESKARREEAWKQFEGEGIVMELLPLKTREERLKFYGSFGGSPPFVPLEKTKRLREAEDTERVYLGFRMMR